jgi:hypothetical protein
MAILKRSDIITAIRTNPNVSHPSSEPQGKGNGRLPWKKGEETLEWDGGDPP